MIAGEVISFVGNSDEVEINRPSIIDIIDCGGGFIEIGANVGKRRVYFKFRLSDLMREVREAKKDA